MHAMQADPVAPPRHEAVAIFDSTDGLQGAIDELLVSGFDQADLSLLASEAAAESKLAYRYTDVHDLADDPNAPRQPYIAPESEGALKGAMIGAPMFIGGFIAIGAIVASGGTLAAVIAGAAAAGGASALIGSFLAQRFTHAHADRIQKEIEKGGLLLWVRTWDERHEARAVAILKKHGGQDVHLHA
jgi:hypothetical protein